MSKQLGELLEGIELLDTRQYDGEREVADLSIDSRSITPEGLYGAIPGTRTDGHRYIDAAIDAGARIILCERYPDQLQDAVSYIRVSSTSSAIGQIAHTFFDSPSTQLMLIGVTGTNGKSTIVSLLYQLYTALGYNCGLFSTIENRIGDKVISASHTTPDAISLNRLLADMVDHGCEYVFMEVSSHAIDQDRIAGLHYRQALFTNLSHDHLDYHGDFSSYLQAKKSWFDQLSSRVTSIINIDDRHGDIMVQNSASRLVRYALMRDAEYTARIIDAHIEGTEIELNNTRLTVSLVGRYNIYNLCATYASASELGIAEDHEILQALSLLQGARGRFERVYEPGRGLYGIIDYAHTPDALENVLKALRDLRRAEARVICVVGCGGDRDRAKRPMMARIAAHYADRVILTSDNPRTEDPEDIIEEMWQGLSREDQGRVMRITDRIRSIKKAVSLAERGDIILIAGKGHENYQEIDGQRYPMDDAHELRIAFSLL